MRQFYVFVAAVLFLCAPAWALDKVYTIRYDGLERVYTVHLPPAYKEGKKLPVVLTLHGGGGDMVSVMSSSGMSVKADKEGFIAVYPEGSGRKIMGKMFATWNGGHCCGKAAENKVDDVGFISRVIDRVVADYHADSRRVYVTGHSNGAIMTYRLACTLSDKIAAFAPVGSSGNPVNCSPERSPPILQIHGREDPCALYDGGKECGGCFSEVMNAMGIPVPRNVHPCEAVPACQKRWVGINGCRDSKPVITTHPGPTTCVSYRQCKDGSEVTLCTIENAGHSWPGSSGQVAKACQRNPNGRVCRKQGSAMGPVNKKFSATDAAWAFFSRYSLPEKPEN